MSIKAILYAILGLLIAGCSTTAIHQAKDIKTSYQLTLKLEKLRFNDGAFLIKSQDTITLQPFALGHSLPTLTLSPRLICLGKLCTTKSSFHASYLHSTYPDDTFERILLGQPVFEGKGLTKTAQGFTQNLGHITYTVQHQNIYFKDRKQRLLIRLRALQ